MTKQAPTYRTQPRGRLTAVLRDGPRGGVRLVEVYTNPDTAERVRAALTAAALYAS